MADSEQNTFSLIKAFIGLFTFAALGLLAVHTVLSWVPKEVSLDTAATGPVLDLAERLQRAQERGYEVQISEAELNAYLNQKVQLQHSSIVDDYITVKGVYAALKPDLIELTVVREIDYHRNTQEDGSKRFEFLPLTQTLTLRLGISSYTDSVGEEYIAMEIKSAEFGKAPAPGGLALLAKPSFDPLAEFFAKEIQSAFNEHTNLKVESGVLIVDASN